MEVLPIYTIIEQMTATSLLLCIQASDIYDVSQYLLKIMPTVV